MLLRVHHVVPDPGALAGRFQIDRHPAVFEPLVEPREQDASRESRLPDLSRQAHVLLRHLSLVVPAVVQPLGLQVREATGRGHTVLGDEQRAPRVVALQVEQIPVVVRGAGGGTRRPVRRIEPDEVRVVGVDVIRGEVAGDVRGGGTDDHRVERLAVVVVLLEPHVRGEAQTLPQCLLLGGSGLGGVVQGVERRPIGVGDRPRCAPDLPLVR